MTPTEAALTNGYGEPALRAAFEQVQNTENWKLPIDATVPVDSDLELLETAIIFFTGSQPSFMRIGITDRIHVEAAGYYEAIGA